MNRLVGISVILLSLGCESEADYPRVTHRDSAGVQIVESWAPQWPEGGGWLVVDSPILDLATSGSGTAHQFFDVIDALRLSDGRLVVADYGSREVRYFSENGEFIGSVGRSGEGPGEFQRLETVGPWRGDSVAVFDFWLARVTILDGEGQLGRTIALQGVADRVRHLRTWKDSGFVGVAYSYASMPTESGRYRLPYSIVRLGPDGALIDTLAMIAGFEAFQYPGGDAVLPFARDGHLAVRGSDLVMGSADGMAFDRHGAETRLAQRVRVPEFDLRLSTEEVDFVRREMFGPGLPAQAREVARSMEVPSSRPAYSKLLIDSDGCVWASPFRARGLPAPPARWQVFAAGGEWLGAVTFPERFMVLEIGSDYVLGVRRDEWDVEHVQLLRLLRATDARESY